VANTAAKDMFAWFMFVGQVFLLGPLIGFAIGAAGAWLMGKADAAFNIRREYQALYGIGLVLLAFTAAELAGGDGFLASFAAGLAVAVLDLEMCGCFLEYGETTAEAAMLLAFILFGAVISQIAWQVPLGSTLLLAVVVILLARPVAISLVLRHASVSRHARAFIGWFGPRGLSSLLLALLMLEGGVPEAELLLAVVGVVVTVSVIAHGATASPLSAWYARKIERETLTEERAGSAAGIFEHSAEDAPRISPYEVAERLADAPPPVILDVRTRSQYKQDGTRIPGSIRVAPDEVEEWAFRQSSAGRAEFCPNLIVAYCTCPNDETSIKAACTLRTLGLEAMALNGGFAAWKSKYPIEPVEKAAVPA
jgi:NhaP-type Na+/H+ or K+/H+ antiporter